MSKSLFRISRLVLPVLFFAVALAGLTFALQRTASADDVSTDAVSLVSSQPLAGQMLFHANLSGAESVPVVETAATGYGVFALNTLSNTLSYRVLVKDITDIAASHIHIGAIGVNGGVEVT